MKLKVGVLGATGYAGVELLRILLKHPGVSLEAATSETYAGKRINEVYPSFLKNLDIVLEKPALSKLIHRCDFFFLALPHGEAMSWVPQLIKAGKTMVDVSGDFRLKDAKAYPRWYGFGHKAPSLLKQAVYGLPELHHEEIRGASLVANPGCYPTSVILAAAPLQHQKIIRPDSLTIDSKSGISGYGRKVTLTVHYAEINENMEAYKVGGVHQHIPEMEQELSLVAGKKVVLSFTPHYAPFTRGIFSTVYADLSKNLSLGDLVELYSEFYKDVPFVRVYPQGNLPDVKAVYGSNYCDLGLALDSRTKKVIVISTIDNLVKGAAGQAVQNMNLMAGFPETTGLQDPGLVP